eukprot:jgi/Undpi1/12421/HiC_scaffold_5.g02093.m1
MQVDLRFRDVHFSVAVSKAKAALTGGQEGVKDILKGVSGAVESGQILAIIGSSGAGKTSLLDILVGKIAANTRGFDVTGDITVNGQPMSRKFFLENAAYVPQEDRLWSALTVRENLMFACKMYGPSLSRAECDDRVDEVLVSLGLDSCQHTKVGNVFLKGISGGQKRRTSIGVELVVHRNILFLDEPTSGLDAASASGIMALLRRIASDSDVIIVTSVHQPSSRVFHSFDQVILLTMGQTAYFGPADHSLAHFANLGHEPKGMVNPADYLLEITNADFSDREAVQWLADAWHKTAACKTLNERLASETPLPLLARPKRGCLSNLRQLRALMMRASMNSSRDPAAYAFRLVLYVFMSVFLGSVYYKVKNTQVDILNRAFLILWMNAFNSFMNLAAIPVFGLEKDAVVKEVQNGQYGVANFCISNAVVQAPFVLLIALCCSTPVYWMTDMNSDPIRFYQFLLVMFLMLFVIESMAQLIGVLVKNFILAIAVFASILSIFFIFNGFFIDPDNMPDFWIWIYWLSPLRYAWEALAKIVFDGQDYSGIDTCFICYGETGGQVLDSLSGGGVNLREVHVFVWCGALVGLSLMWRAAHYVALSRLVR